MAELQQDLATAPPPVAASGPNVVEDEPTPLQPSGDRPPPARGILKNPIRGGSMSEGARGDHLQWDEANIALTEIQKDSLMKIDEPKTPYVRYDAENDVVLSIGDVPEFDLGAEGEPPLSPSTHTSSSATSARELSHTTQTNTESNARRPSSSGSSRSSRSASFSLPDKPHPVRPGHPSSPTQAIPTQLGATYANTHANTHPTPDGPGSVSGSDVFADSDEEALDEEAKAHKRDFEKKRAMHYENEAALALKKAREMEDEDEEGDSDEPAQAQAPPVPNGANGVA